MSSASIVWLSRCAYVSFGLVLGFVISRSMITPGLMPVSMVEPTSRQFNADELKVLLEKVVRSELKDQLSVGFASLQKENPTVATVAACPERNVKDQPAAVDVEQMERNYSSANHILDTALSGGGFTTDSAIEFVDYLHSLPPDKELEVRARYAHAVNMGVIKPTKTPDAIAAERGN